MPFGCFWAKSFSYSHRDSLVNMAGTLLPKSFHVVDTLLVESEVEPVIAISSVLSPETIKVVIGLESSTVSVEVNDLVHRL